MTALADIFHVDFPAAVAVCAVAFVSIACVVVIAIESIKGGNK